MQSLTGMRIFKNSSEVCIGKHNPGYWMFHGSGVRVVDDRISLVPALHFRVDLDQLACKAVDIQFALRRF